MAQSGKLILNPSINNPGIYFLRLSTTERAQTFKIVKE